MKNMQTFGRITSQRGSMLLEALIAILIFSMGVLAIVGMQAASIRNSSESKYRSDANVLANQLIGQMWASDRTIATLKTNFEGGTGGANGIAYQQWLRDVQALPGTDGNPPSVSVDAVGPPPGLVTIVIRWKAPGEDASSPAHALTVVAQVQ